MRLRPDQVDRAAGVLLGAACGDALGAGYEFGVSSPPPVGQRPAMIGGGLGNFAPGEWTDDTAQTYAIAQVAARRFELGSVEALDEVARGLGDWYAGRHRTSACSPGRCCTPPGPAPLPRRLCRQRMLSTREPATPPATLTDEDVRGRAGAPAR
jgi:hypothetical protein